MPVLWHSHGHVLGPCISLLLWRRPCRAMWRRMLSTRIVAAPRCGPKWDGLGCCRHVRRRREGVRRALRGFAAQRSFGFSTGRAAEVCVLTLPLHPEYDRACSASRRGALRRSPSAMRSANGFPPHNTAGRPNELHFRTTHAGVLCTDCAGRSPVLWRRSGATMRRRARLTWLGAHHACA